MLKEIDNMTEVEIPYTVEASNGTLTVVERLANLLETGQFSDFTFKVGAGDEATTFKAHKMLLATASQPLHSLVTSCLERQNGMTDNLTLNVTDIDPESFQHILKYIYTDDVRVSSIGEALNLMKYSEKWSLNPLGVKTIKFMHQFLNEYEPFPDAMKNDLCDLLIWSENNKNEPINKRSWEVMMRNINEIVPCQTFLNMEENMVRKLLIHEKFHYKNQLMLFEAIRDWGMNQILTKHMNVNQLQSVIAGLLKHINFKDMEDGDFASTIMPSACLGRAELIAFFLCKGQDMPKDLGENNVNQVPNVMKSASTLGQEKACRFRRGYKVIESEIYKPHELRFRVDRDICILGVGFGFLFSNVDLGVTVHCQGPWEAKQWTDIIQTYCRIAREELNTTNIKLMFNEPIIIQANQSYKILARIGRMSAGASDVDLWGGCEGLAVVDAKGAKFHILKNAVPPDKDVEEKDKDYSQGLITDIIYQLEFDPLSRVDNTAAPPVRVSTIIPSIDTTKALNIKSYSSIKSPVSSPTTIIPKTTRKESNYNKENIVPHQIIEQKPELPWLTKRTTIINNREDKPLLSPFRKSRPSDTSNPNGDKVTLPWQRKSSITNAEPLATYSFRPTTNSSYSQIKPKSTETNKTPWSAVELRNKPSYSSILNKSSEFSISKPRDTSTSSYRNYSSYSGSTNSPRSTLGYNSYRDTNKYSTSLSNSRDSVASKYNNPSSKINQHSRDNPSSSLLREGFSTRPSAILTSFEKPTSFTSRYDKPSTFSSRYDKPLTNASNVSSSYSEKPKLSSIDRNKYSTPFSKPSSYNSSLDNVPYRSSISRISQTRDPSSRMNDSKSTIENSSKYQRSTKSISKCDQLNGTERHSNIRNQSFTSGIPSSTQNQPYSSIKTPNSYSSYNNYRSNDTSTGRKTDFSPASRQDFNKTTATKDTYPYSSKISSLTSKWQAPSSGSSYYRR